jgi:Cof subfamily protein (haloacid dehalogenase superfamily)
MTRRIALLLSDVDGTLVTPNKELTEATRLAVHDLDRAGIRFAITSGRPPRGMRMLIEPLAIDTPIAGFNGGAFVNPDLSLLEERRLDHEIGRKTLSALLAHRVDAWLYTGQDWFVTRADAPHVAREAWTVQFNPTVVERFTDEHLDQAVKIVGVSDDFATVEKCEADLQRDLGRKASVARSQPYYLDVTHPEANKGAVVLALSKRLQIAPEEIATIGDMPNDVLMFRVSGFSIAMGNASDAVKAAANVVTKSNEEDGFAYAVRHFVLEER